MKTTHTIKHVSSINPLLAESGMKDLFADQSKITDCTVSDDYSGLPTNSSYSILDTALWNEPYNQDMVNRVSFLNLSAGESLNLKVPENDSHSLHPLSYHNLVFCLTGTLSTGTNQELTNEHIGYNPPDHPLNLKATMDSTVMMVGVAQAFASATPTKDPSSDALQVKALSDLEWIYRPGREALISYPQDTFGFASDYRDDKTFSPDNFKLLYFTEGSLLKAHMHETTQFKALLSGHIVYQDEPENSDAEQFEAGDLACVKHHTVYKGETEKSYMALFDFSPKI